jgi:porphobilinogen synthase
MTDSPRFPVVRMRRLRHHPQVRRLVRETTLSPSNFVLPLFVRSGKNESRPIGSMPGHFQLSVDRLRAEAKEAEDLGLGGVILFGIPDEKDAVGSDSCQQDGIIQQAVRAVKDAAPDLLVITDVCYCEYTDHGHCGELNEKTGRVDVDNDVTLQMLGKQAQSHAEAGSDMVAPSGMMDGMVDAIRRSLDNGGFEHLPIMSYSVKYASAYYGPFRDAADSSPQFGDRRGYQMDPASAIGQAIREVKLDLQEGADIIMVKPALAYLDVIARMTDQFPDVPMAAYNVSGEFSMVKAAAANGWIDEQAVAMETLTAIRRAGANIILTYWAKQAAGWLA